MEDLRFPLHWPAGYARTAHPKPSRFKTTPDKAQQMLREEVKRIRGTNLIISTNMPVRKDGGYMSTARPPQDRGVAIYFRTKGRDVAFCCDYYEKVHENILALAHTMKAMRDIARHGAANMEDRIYTGFLAIPENTGRNWWNVLDVAKEVTFETAQGAYRLQCHRLHPDKGGSQEGWTELQQAWENAKKHYGR